MIEHVLTTRHTAAGLVARPVRWAAGAVDRLLLCPQRQRLQSVSLAQLQQVLAQRWKCAALEVRERWGHLIVIQSRALPRHVAATLARQHLRVGGGSVALERQEEALR